MKKEVFSQIIKKIPVVDYGIDGLEVHRSHTKEGTMWFVTAHKEVVFPEHTHAEQWTIVLSGKCSYTANGVTTVYKKGDTYTIPDHTPHQLTLHKGYSEVDYVDDPFDGD
ncbi:MAG TPA: cupin domain-containing protein [Succinivibrionaceae bacterium]|nr:cupin domain-containing protein [Succinivibrionaceae bacterium]